MHETEIVLWVLLIAVVGLITLAGVVRIPYPVFLVVGGLVLAPTVVVAVVAHAVIDSLTWPAAFVLGAVVSPTDPVAATAIARRLGIPRRIVTIVEGESLVNDASALVLYRAAVVAVVAGSFSLADAGLRFVLSVIGGVAVGLA